MALEPFSGVELWAAWHPCMEKPSDGAFVGDHRLKLSRFCHDGERWLDGDEVGRVAGQHLTEFFDATETVLLIHGTCQQDGWALLGTLVS